MTLQLSTGAVGNANDQTAIVTSSCGVIQVTAQHACAAQVVPFCSQSEHGGKQALCTVGLLLLEECKVLQGFRPLNSWSVQSV